MKYQELAQGATSSLSKTYLHAFNAFVGLQVQIEGWDGELHLSKTH